MPETLRRPDYLFSERGVGYRMPDPGGRRSSPRRPKTPPSPPSPLREGGADRGSTRRPLPAETLPSFGCAASTDKAR